MRLGDLDGNWGYNTATWGIAIVEYTGSLPNLTYDQTNGLRLRSGSNTKIQFDTVGNANFTGVISIGTNGGIYQGTGSFASPTTGLKIWNQSGVGRIAGYQGGTLQWGANTSGQLTAGGGYVTIDAEGITIETDDDIFEENSITWKTNTDSLRF